MTDKEGSDMKDEETDEPKVLESEEDEIPSKSDSSDVIEQSSHINATREEAAWEAQAEDIDSDSDSDDGFPELIKDKDLEEDPEGDPENLPKEDDDSAAKFSTLDELMLDTVPYKTKKVGSNLRAELTGTIILNFGKDKYLFEWKDDLAKTSKLSGSKTKADCEIKLKSADFFDIAKGKLNPQVAMLSDKVHVDGKLSFAVYFFNLFARQSHR